MHGLVALMEIQASRSRARVGPSGEIVLLLDQDRGRWDPLHISRGLAALGRAEKLDGALGPYALQAAIAACHARARSAADTDWARIAALYDALADYAVLSSSHRGSRWDGVRTGPASARRRAHVGAIARAYHLCRRPRARPPAKPVLR